jgi:type II secretory pathway pseudopilin PulG
MKFFTKKEIAGILLIFGFIFLISFSNFKVSLRKARDFQRKNDLRALYNGLSAYQKDWNTFPLSLEGKIVACKGADTFKDEEGSVFNLYPCEWGKDALKDVFDANYPAYIPLLPQDPQQAKGNSYLYLSNGKRFQIYIVLEGEDEAEYDPAIVKRNLKCGEKICNAGLAFGATPLDKSIEEYENELLKKKKAK